MNSTGSIHGPMIGFCEQGNDPSDSTKRDGHCQLSEQVSQEGIVGI